MSADRNDDPWKSPKGDPRQHLAPSAPWIVEALGVNAPTRSIGHYIDGPARTGRHAIGARVQSRNGRNHRECLPRGLRDGRARRRRRQSRPARLGRHAAAEARARAVSSFKELLDANFDELAALITREHGKVLADAKGELTRGLEIVEFACGIPQLLKGQYSDNVGGGIDNWSLRQPVGVCAGITPFNFPAMVPMWMFPLAIACGNTFVLKPSERDPSTSLKLGAAVRAKRACRTACSTSCRATRRPSTALLEHPDVAAVSFVGSTPVAEHIYSDGTQPRQTRAGARRRQEPHGRHARRRSRPGRRRADRRGLRLGRRALHGDLGRRRGRRHRRRARREARAAHPRAQGQRRQRAPAPTWGR